MHFHKCLGMAGKLTEGRREERKGTKVVFMVVSVWYLWERTTHADPRGMTIAKSLDSR